MSHSVTIQTRTVTTGSPSPVNTGFCRSWTGILKIAQVVAGIIVMSLMLSHYNYDYSALHFLLVVSSAFMIGSAIFIISYIFSPVTEAIISKTNYEIFYNGFATFFLLIASIVVISTFSRYAKTNTIIAAGAFGLIDAILYGVNLAIAIKNKV